MCVCAYPKHSNGESTGWLVEIPEPTKPQTGQLDWRSDHENGDWWALGTPENTVEIGWFRSFNPPEKYESVQVYCPSKEMSEAL